ncbi:MAG: type II toxin-antitoxin system Phd/YefM family antitoxin [bacterium]|nr:type II toxin-antitoxin system Phd/YefM family antitoxin [bacterium]
MLQRSSNDYVSIVTTMAVTISKSQFKPKALEYLRLVELKRERLIITHKGKPVAQVMPYEDESEAIRKKLANSLLFYTDPLEPVGLEDWEALQ